MERENEREREREREGKLEHGRTREPERENEITSAFPFFHFIEQNLIRNLIICSNKDSRL